MTVPVDTHGSRRVLFAILSSALVVTLFLVWFITLGPGRWTGREPSAMEAMATQVSVTYVQPTAVVTALTPIPTASAVAVPAAKAPTGLTEAAALDAMVEDSKVARQKVAFKGQWAAQLASKYVGIVDPQQRTAAGSHTFMAADIYAEHEALDQHITGASVFLLDSRSFGGARNYNGFPYWVTVAVSDKFTSSDDVLGWCATQFPSLSGSALNNRCLATQLTA